MDTLRCWLTLRTGRQLASAYRLGGVQLAVESNVVRTQVERCLESHPKV